MKNRGRKRRGVAEIDRDRRKGKSEEQRVRERNR